MRALRCEQLQSPPTMTLVEQPVPEPAAGQVRLRVRAAGLNFADTLMLQGLYQVRPDLPFTPGMEICGEVEAVGEGVGYPRVGDRVAAIVNWGGWAEYVCVPAPVCLPIPEAMSFEQGASFPIAYGTSHMALDHRARLREGEWLLVHGAAGGVGSTAVEIGAAMGARVIATASTSEKLELAKSKGAAHLINYKEENFRERVKELTEGHGADVIYDPVGGDVFAESMRCIAWEGRLVVIGFASGQIPQVEASRVLVKNCSVMGLYWGEYAKRDLGAMLGSFRKLMGWFEDGTISPQIGGLYAMEDAQDAVEAMMNRQVKGKVVLQMG